MKKTQLLFVLAALAMLFSASIQAQPFLSPTDCMPAAGANMRITSVIGYPSGHTLSNSFFDVFTVCQPPPPLGATQVYSSPCNFHCEMSSGGPPSSFTAPAVVTIRMTHTSDAGPDRIFQTEMLALDITGGNFPSGFKIRESPTLQSTGQTSIRTMGGGQYQIDSFFDVFTELSLDGGANWTPTNTGPAHVRLEPTASIPTMGEWGLIAMAVLLLATGAAIIVKRKAAFVKA